jgi:hypothetical protein
VPFDVLAALQGCKKKKEKTRNNLTVHPEGNGKIKDESSIQFWR